MKTLLKNGKVVNVFTGEIQSENVLLENGKIIGVGDYSDGDGDFVQDVSGKYICPGFIDGHIHIESTMMTPVEFAKAALPCGTTSVVADPHEIANVCGKEGIEYMLKASEDIPLTVYVTLPSCVPSTGFDESGAVLDAEALEEFYAHPRVKGLGEVMNHPGVVAREPEVMEKIACAKRHNAVICGHAPLLSGKALDRYVSAGITDDHECSSFEEAKERIRKGQYVMIREGTAAKNLKELISLFDEPWASRCMLVCDDRHPQDLIEKGHIDDMIRMAAREGKNPVTAIQMATIRAAEYFGLENVGAVAPGYDGDLLVLDSLEELSVCDVYKNGVCVVKDKKVHDFKMPDVPDYLENKVKGSFFMEELTEEKFKIDCNEKRYCNVVEVIKHSLITEKKIMEIDFASNNGIDLKRDVLKLAVVERHRGTGNMGVGFITGLGIKRGAIASSVSHDSHNLIIVGTSERDMAVAGNRIRQLGGGLVVVDGGKILAELPLPIAGLVSDLSAKEIAKMNSVLREKTLELGVESDAEPFMTTAFVSLPVIPHIKMTTYGLVDVDCQKLIDLFA